MKRIFIMCHILLVLTGVVAGQKFTDANVFGHVVTKETGEHLPHISLTLKGTTIGTATDLTGHYFLKNLPVGTYTIVASGVGYKTLEKKALLISGKSLELDFEVEEDKVLLDGVVVSASRNETNRKETSAIVNIMTPMLFENTNSVCLSQGLNFQTGVRVETNCQNCGFTQVRINGLDGPYSQILIDGRPVFSSLAGVYGLEQIPANMIERVEVVRGGGSAVFGSNAIAGTINIITREPLTNSAEFSNTTNLIYGKTPDVNTTLNSSVVSDDRKSGIMVFGSTRQRVPFDYDGDSFSEIGKLNSKNVGFRSYYRTGDFSKISFEYHNLGEFRRGGNKFDLPPHQSDISEQLEHNINNGGLKFDLFSKNYKHRITLFSSMQKVERSSYYGAQQNPNAYGITDDKTFVGGFQYAFLMDSLFPMPSELTMGAEYNLNELNDEATGYNRVFHQKVSTQSLFIQNEWKNQKFSFLLGGRLDNHNLIKNPVISPRLSLRFAPSDAVNLRMSYSGGFRPPQAFDEDLHINVIGGRASVVQLDPDLKMERSVSYSASVDLYKTIGIVQTNLLIEGFYTNLSDVFVLEERGFDTNGNLILERINGSGAVVQGVNMEGKVALATRIQFQFGATFQASTFKVPQSWSNDQSLAPQRKMFRTPDEYGYLTLNYKLGANFNIAITGTYTGPMLVQHFAGYVASDSEKMTHDFLDLNIRLAYDFVFYKKTKIQLSTGVQNVINSYQSDFDKGEFRDAAYIYGPSLPRTFFFGLKFSI